MRPTLSPRPALELPFFGPEHRALARPTSRQWAHSQFPRCVRTTSREPHVDARARALVRALGTGGFTRYCVRAEYGGALPEFDSRAICLHPRDPRRITTASPTFRWPCRASAAVRCLCGQPELASRYLPRVAKGEAIAAFALSEPDAGSDVAAMHMSARRDGEHYVLDGAKTWISNGGIADFYCVFARTEAGQAPR